MQHTDIEPDGYFPVAKHARRTPTSPHLAAVPTNGTSNSRAGAAPAGDGGHVGAGDHGGC